MADIILYFLLVLALGGAWYSGYRSQRKNKFTSWNKQDKDYFIGLNYLLNDEPDQSIDAFISALEVNSTTLESHLALGTLLRRRGKVEDSITVFQNLLAENQLDTNELNKVKLGLVKSYVRAGLLDRAERLIDELKVAEVDVRYAALVQGITVYQLEKEWLKAIMLSNELLTICPTAKRQEFQLKTSHFYCELAEKEMEFQHYNQAREYLYKASSSYKTNVRANLLLSRLEFAQGHYKQAIKVMKKITSQDAGFKAEVFDLIIDSYQALGREAELQSYIEKCLHESPSSALILKIISHIEESQGREVARNLLLQQLNMKPSIKLLGDAILLNAKQEDQGIATLFNNTLREYLQNKPAYQCKNCGFELQRLHWLCPGCSEWGFVKPFELQTEKSPVT